MDDHPERRRYYPVEENVPLSEAVREAVQDHEHSSLSMDELTLYDTINPDAIDMLFEDTTDLDVSVQINLTNVTVSIWSDDGIDIRVTEKIE
ncbi:HalOD1 output domain-containing protein [Halorientalis halophila]|uniref:HalOD1 output domain-containing protein n=1 Tax=Halorientalis halophila TaxID=3108499 RepID=UPI00300BCFC5